MAALISRRHSLVLPEEDSNHLVTGSGARLHVLDDANAGLVPAVFLNPGLFASGVSIVKTLLSARAVSIHKQKWHRCNFNDNDGCIPSKPVSSMHNTGPLLLITPVLSLLRQQSVDV